MIQIKKSILRLLILLVCCNINCTINQINTPSIQLNNKNCTLISIDSNFIVDSVSFESYEKSKPLFTLKKVDRYMSSGKDSLNYCDGLNNCKTTGSYDSVRSMKKVILRIFLKSRNKDKLYYSSIEYSPTADSIYFLKAIGDI